jgi:hypothetical protein
MSINLINKSIIPLLLSTLLLGVFYWQFTYIYAFLITNFTEDKLSILYSHLFIYSFLVLILFISLINLFNYFVIKSKIFVFVTTLVLLIFYILSYSVYIDLFKYFLSLPLSDNIIMGSIFFVVGTLGYSLYSSIGLFFNQFIPLLHILIFTLLGVSYGAFFIDMYCYPITEILMHF